MNQPAIPSHGRKLGLIGVALTRARNPKFDVQALASVRDEVEAVLIESGFCEGTPFSWITLSIRFGLKNESEPHYQNISKKHGDLPMAIEVSTEDMEGKSLEELKRLFKNTTVKALIHAGKKFARPVEALKSIRIT